MSAAVRNPAGGRSRIYVGTPREISGASTATKADDNGLIALNSASAAAVTIPTDAAAGWSGNEFLTIAQRGAGAASFVAASGVTLRKASGIADSVQYGIIAAVRMGTNEWWLV